MGKTVFAVNKGIKKVLTCPLPEPRVMYCAPLLKQAKTVAWDYVCHYSRGIPGVKINKGALSVDYPNGGRFTLAGSDNVDAHRGIYLDHLVCDEYAQQSPRVWTEVFRPALSDRKGSADFIGTPKGRGNGFYDLFERAANAPEWSRHVFKASETGLIDPAELESARRDMSDDEYNQEYECSFDAALKGAYYTKEMAQATAEKRITRVAYQVDAPVFTCCDLGMRDSFAIWFFQFAGNEIHFIDYQEYMGMGLPQVIAELRKKPYQYADHIAPHDIRVRELGTGVSRQETARKLGINYKVAKNIDLMDGIDAVRNLLKRAWFDSEKCKPGIEALRSYRSEYDQTKRIISTTPVHDWTSHGADAMRYVAVTYGKGSPPTFFNQGELDYSRMNRRTI